MTTDADREAIRAWRVAERKAELKRRLLRLFLRELRRPGRPF